MPEILSLLNNELPDFIPYPFLQEQFKTSKKEKYFIEDVMIKTVFGGMSHNFQSPIISINDISIVCDGKIYNSQELYEELQIVPFTEYDYEIIIHVYHKYGMERTLQLLDGIFSFILIDYRFNNANLDFNIYIARDPFGVKPLYALSSSKIKKENISSDFYGFATNRNILEEIKRYLENKNPNSNNKNYLIEEFLPGTYSKFELKSKVLSSWKKIKHQIPFHSFGPSMINMNLDSSIKDLLTINHLKAAVKKRCQNINTTTILFDNNESIIMTDIANKYFIEKYNIPIKCYSLGSDNKQYYEKYSFNVTEVEVTGIESEKENIHLSLKEEGMDLQEFYNWWFLAKCISNDKPKSLVLLNIGVDDLISKKKDYSWLEYRFLCEDKFKNVYRDYLKNIYKIFYHFGLEIDFPWLDRNLTSWNLLGSGNRRFP
jgi:hypothetical protein